jgi:hypothetical protein
MRFLAILLAFTGAALSVEAGNTPAPAPVLRSLRDLTPLERAKVASRLGWTSAQANAVAARDKDAMVSSDGHALYACRFPAITSKLVPGEDPAGFTNRAEFPLNQTFLLHSRPGAKKIIYLDFDGCNDGPKARWGNPSVTGVTAYDFDGNPQTFSDSERSDIQVIWRMVAEDFAVWDVDVTTEPPTDDAIRVLSSGDDTYGVIVGIGPRKDNSFISGAGGVAFVSSFKWGDGTPCWVFNIGGKYAAEAVSHEVGHTLGLGHDGKTDGTEYYGGHANWGPIMGVGYYGNVAQWSKGEYDLASNTQDDIAVITSYLPKLTDDIADNMVRAKSISGTAVLEHGIINSATDKDWFAFKTGAGLVTLNVKVAAYSPNLDTRLTILDSSGGVVATSAPGRSSSSDGLESSLMIPLAEGEYYAVIESSASGTSATTGYTTYASIGHYSLTGTLRPSTLVSKPPVASTAGTSPLKGSAPLIVGFNGTQSSDPDGIVVEYLWTFDDGTTAITANPTRTFTTPGIHPVTLLVTDNQGLTGTTNLNIEVVNSRIIFVSAIVPGFSGTGASASADILVTVKDDKGALVANAMVYGRLSGIGQGDVIGRTNSKGQVRLRGRIPPLTRGALTFTVTNLTLAGGIYDASFNVETTDSVSR